MNDFLGAVWGRTGCFIGARPWLGGPPPRGTVAEVFLTPQFEAEKQNGDDH
jgi:hypothetical protein